MKDERLIQFLLITMAIGQAIILVAALSADAIFYEFNDDVAVIERLRTLDYMEWRLPND